MIDSLPYWLPGLFIITTIATLILFFWAHPISKLASGLIGIWILIQSVLSFNLFYRVTDKLPPRFVFVLLPAFIFILAGLTKSRLNNLLTNKNLSRSTLIHTVRFPVELCLHFLFLYDQIPELLTYHGVNFDILAGLTAPLIVWLFGKKIIGLKGMLYWNVVALGLVLFVLVNGVLSSEIPFQIFGLDQPNVGMTYFPFILLPALIVPLVVYTHITDIIHIRRLLKGQS